MKREEREYKGDTETASRKEIANKIVQLRKESGITQLEMAKRLNIGQTQISRYESGRANISIDTLSAIVNAVDSEIVFIKKQQK